MREYAKPASLALVACLAIVTAILLMGCGKKEVAYPGMTPSTPPGVPGAPGSRAPAGQPGAPAQPPTPPQLPAGYPAPATFTGGAPPTGAMTPPAASPAVPAAPAAPPGPKKGAVPFSKAPVKSPVVAVSHSVGGGALQFLRFKYLDTKGRMCLAEMPAAETKVDRTPGEWLVTFDLYKKESVAKPTGKQPEKAEPLSDFPFVSPPPGKTSSGESPGAWTGPPGGPTTPR